MRKIKVESRKMLIWIFLLTTSLLSNYTKAQTLSLEQRIDTLIQSMTVEEKLAQLYNNGFMTTPNNNRLNIPGFIMNDGPHGMRFDKASAFPTGIAMAATWDKAMLWQIGKAMGEEFWAYGKHQQLGPCIDLSRDPRAGRSAEGGSEDPYLSGQIGAAVIKGIQTTPVIATVKHFMVESKQSYRNSCNEIYTERWLMEHYGYNFRTSVQEGASMSIMSSYNLINGLQASESPLLLQKALRQRWGFPFYVVSDWGAVHDTKKAMVAGNDVCMGSDNYKNDLPTLVSSGQLSINYVNTAVRNVLRTKILAGILDYYPTGSKSLINSTEHQKICKTGAQKSIILLKNQDRILPLNKNSITKIAVIGPNADKGNLNCYGSSETSPFYSISVRQGLINKLGAAKVSYALGCDVNSTSTTGYQSAKDIAAQADFVIFAGGLDDTQEGEAYNIGNDRKSNSPDLPGKQQDLINQLAAVNPNIIVVLQSGGVCSVHSCISNIKGFIYSFYAGEEAGTAIADVIFGDYNPAGRMPVTMPTGLSQLPAWDDNFTNDFGCGYRWFDEKKYTPEYAFGFGLSYTSFEYSNLHIANNTVQAGAPVEISVDVQNIGKIDGDEVVQLYLTNKAASIWMPTKELKGFERINLLSGEKKTVTFKLSAEDFYYWNETNSAYEVFPGDYSFAVGGSSDSLPLTGSIQLETATAKPDLKITQVFTMPRYPIKGQRVTFYALVKNQGTATITPNNKFDIAFNIDQTLVASAKEVAITLSPGQAALIASNDTSWLTSQVGKNLLSAKVDNNGSLDEWIETNNEFNRPYEVFFAAENLSETNAAYKKPVYVSSVENNDATLLGTNLVDGNLNSRWASAYTDPQLAVIDLQKEYKISQIILHWEAAYATSYEIALSADSANWTTVASVTNGKGGTETYNIGTAGWKYVKITFQKRATTYGNSLYEIEVLNADAPVLIAPPTVDAGNDSTIEMPVTSFGLNGSKSIDPNGKTLNYKWQQLLGPNNATIIDDTKTSPSISNLMSGTYIFKLTVDNGDAANSDLVKVTVNPAKTILPIPDEIVSINNNVLNIYPNPATEYIKADFAGENYNSISITDVSGRTIASKNITKGATSVQINIANLKRGLYFVTTAGTNNKVTRKLIVK